MTSNQILPDGVGPWHIITANFNQIDKFINICKCNKKKSVVYCLHLHPYNFLLQAVRLLKFVSKYNIRQCLMFIYTHIFSYYKLFLYLNLYLSVMVHSLSFSFTPIYFLTASCSFTSVCGVVYCSIVLYLHLHPCPSLLQAVSQLEFVSQCNV